MGEYRTEVERGAEFLDGIRPGWREVINLDRLALRECTTCVLGQLAGADTEVTWTEVLATFGLPEISDDDDRMGFNIGDFAVVPDEAWAALTEEWRGYILETRSAVSA